MSELWTSLGTAVLHFLWQGTLVGILTALGLAALGRRSPDERHGFAFGSLVLSFALFAGTFAWAYLRVANASHPELSPMAVGAFQGMAEEGLGSLAGRLELSRLAAVLWILGFTFMSLRLALQCRAVRRLKTCEVTNPDPTLLALYERLRDRLGVDRGVRLLASGLAEVPMVVGWLSPVVLVPASALTGLGPDQLKSLLAHELAHVRRRDPWFNAIQAVVEAVLFFHPAIWWISKQVRVEREFCCDDSSLAVTGSPRLLAEALAAMETLRPETPLRTQTVLGAHGGPLMQRIARILGAQAAPRPFPFAWQVPAGLALAGLLALGGSVYASPQSEKKGERPHQEHAYKQREKVDLEKVRAELEAAVKSGRITREQANQRLERLDRGLAVRREAERVRAKLQAAVADGKLTQAEADAKYHQWQQDQEEHQRVRVQAESVWKELQQAVKAGEITEEQAKEQMAAWEKDLHQHQMEIEAERVWAELQESVRAGKITEAQAKERMAAFKKRFRNREKREENPEEVIKRIQSAVEAGRLTPAEGKARIEAFREELAAKKAARRQYEEVAKTLKEAVAAGRMTEQEADKKLGLLRRKLFPDTSIKERVGRALEEIEAALKAGKITAEEARLRREELRRKMADFNRENDLHKRRERGEAPHEEGHDRDRKEHGNKKKQRR